MSVSIVLSILAACVLAGWFTVPTAAVIFLIYMAIALVALIIMEAKVSFRFW